MIKNIVIGVLVVTTLLFRGLYFRGAGSVGSISWEKDSFLQGLTAGRTAQFEISDTGAVTTTGGVTLGSGGTALSFIKTASASTCTASSSVAISSATTLECAVTGVLSTDTILMSPGAAASSVYLSVTGAFASSTANGYVRYIVANASSTAAVTSNQTDVRNVDLFIFR